MRTTTAEKKHQDDRNAGAIIAMDDRSPCDENATGIFANVPDLEPALYAPLTERPMTGFALTRRLGRPVSATLAALHTRGIVQRRTPNVLVAPLPYADALLDYLGGGAKRQPLSTDTVSATSDEVLGPTQRLFHSQMTMTLLSALLNGPVLASDFGAHSALRREARHLCAVGILQHRKVGLQDVYQINEEHPKASLLRQLVAAVVDTVPQIRWTKRSKGFKSFGEGHPNAKLSDRDVREIIDRAKAGESAKMIAQDFGITAIYVRALQRGKYRRSMYGHSQASA